MADRLDYAQLSSRVYQRTDQNRTPAGDWQELNWRKDDPITGFSVGAYKKGNEVVISFTGTNEGFVKDFDVGNIPAGVGIGSPQIVQAMVFVMQVMASNTGAVFSFTGHSLGGGLASVMAVFFDKPATIFDPAPIENSARNPGVLLGLQFALAHAGYTNPTFNEYSQSFGFLFSQREKNVQSFYLQGEALEALRAVVPVIAGSEKPDSVGDPSILDTFNPRDRANASVTLHSMTLLDSVLESSAFLQGVTQQRQAIEVFFDNSLYATDPQYSATPDFLNRMLNQQLSGKGVGTATGLLDSLGTDLLRIGNSGTASSKEINLGVLAALTEYYRYLADAGSQGFIESIEGGIKLDFSSIAADSDRHGQERLLSQLNKWLDQQGEAVAVPAHVDRFIVQSGDGGVAALEGGDDKSDFIVGGSTTDQMNGGGGRDTLIGLGGDDYLSGDQGNDTLYGGADDDTLIGGTGADTLLGGTGNDTYIFSSGDGADVIRDDDGQGHIEVDGQTLNGGKKRAPGAWVSGDGKFEYSLVNNSTGKQDLIIGHAGQSDRIVVQNWQAEQLGIHLDDASATTTQPTRQIVGDLAPVVTDGGAYQWDDYGNLVTTEQAQPGFADVLFGSSGDDQIAGGAGSDSLKGADGNDTLDGGAGDDLISGGAGQDILTGGDGSDFIFAGGTYSGTPPLGPAYGTYVPQPGATIVGATWSVAQKTVDLFGTPHAVSSIECVGSDDPNDVGDIIDAGAGNDYVDGGYGDDVIAGGEGNDDLRGGAGNDVIDGGTGDDFVLGDNVHTDGILGAISAAEHGNDVLSGGDGNDTLIGQGGNDELYGGTGDDTLMGDNRDLLDTPVDVAGQDTLDGGAGNDVLVGGAKEDVLIGGDGNDSLWGDDTAETLDGAFHADDSLDGGAGNDELTGGGGADVLVGGEGNDKLFGDEQSNKLGVQYQGDDTLDGGAGNDIMQAGTGHDWLQGGAGDDTLVGSDDLLSPGSSDWAALFAAHGRAYAGNSDLNAYQNVLLGGDGNDTIIGGAGRNCLQGDAGVYGYTRVAANDERFLAVA